jgi:hypothetical protein
MLMPWNWFHRNEPLQGIVQSTETPKYKALVKLSEDLDQPINFTNEWTHDQIVSACREWTSHGMPLYKEGVLVMWIPPHRIREIAISKVVPK